MNRLLISLLFLIVPTSLFAQQLPALQVVSQSLTRSEDQLTASVLFVLVKHTAADFADIDVDLTLASAGRAMTLTATRHPAWTSEWSCESTGPQSIRCRLPLFRGSAGAFVPLIVNFTPANEGRFSLTAKATGRTGETTVTTAPATFKALFPRDVLITNTRDAGEGSLRAAIEYANDTCARDNVPCALRFRFTEPLPEQGWYTIRPMSALPAITAPDISIEREVKDPRVELDGSLLATGYGLALRGDGPATIEGLWIGGFPWDGLAITRRGGTDIYECLIGLRPNNQPNPNGGRGVIIDPPAADVNLSGCRMSSNVRSGVFIWGGERITLDYNVIGVHAWNDPALGNGASGVFAGPLARGVVINRTFIGGNAHMGVAVARGARGVRVDNSWIDPNHGLPIDHGIDEFSGYVGNPSEFALPAPRITSATYDSVTNKSTIRGTFMAPDPALSWKLTIVPDRMGIWPEMSLATHVFTGTTFEVAVQGRAEGTRVTVSSAQPSDWSTSELSEAVVVSASGNKLLSTVLRNP